MKAQNASDGSLIAHYRRIGLRGELLTALEKSGKTLRTYEDSAAFDEFHMRGRDATRDLAWLAGIGPGMQVLDLGCGLGGPARLLAAEHDARVVGVDLMEEFVEVACMLSKMVGMERGTAFFQGDMMRLPFAPETFDVVWSQHTLMSIPDKALLFGEIHRVLAPDGTLAFYDVVAGSVHGRHYPVQWASDASMDHLPGELELCGLLNAAGFTKVAMQDETDACLNWFEGIRSRMKKRAAAGRAKVPAAPGLQIVIGPDAAEKAANTLRNLKEDRIRVVMGTWRKIQFPGR